MSKYPLLLGVAGAILTTLFGGLGTGEGASAKSIRHVGTIELPVKEGYVDYLVLTPGAHTLYAGYASGDVLIIMDTETKREIASVAGLKDVRSIALVPKLNLGFTSDRGEDTIGVIDLKTHRLLEKIPDGRGPDAIIYDEAARLVYAANHEGRSATLIDPATRKVSAVVELGGAAEYAQADPATGLVYQNLEDTSEVVVVDPRKRAVVARFKTAPGKEPTGLALDHARHRLFSACANNKLVVLDSLKGKMVAELPIGSGVDFVGYDPGLQRIYTANGASGTMTVIRQLTPDKYQVEETVKTHKGAHALAVDVASHRIYVVHGTRIEIYESATH